MSYERLGVYDIHDVLPFITFVTGEKFKQYNKYFVKMTSLRYLTFFEKGTVCISCGLKGKFFALERHSNSPQDKRPHFNLYGYKGGKEIMLTKDHIIARVNGGKDHISNMQTMCSPCNVKKGSR